MKTPKEIADGLFATISYFVTPDVEAEVVKLIGRHLDEARAEIVTDVLLQIENIEPHCYDRADDSVKYCAATLTALCDHVRLRYNRPAVHRHPKPVPVSAAWDSPEIENRVTEEANARTCSKEKTVGEDRE